MIEEHIIKLTEALNANTAALNKILEAGAVAETAATPTPEAAEPAKKRNKKAPEPITLYEDTPAPAEEPEAGTIPDPGLTDEAPVEETPAPVTEVPDLPIAELRDSLKQLIKKSLEDRPTTRDNFDSLREKFGIKLLKDLTDDQVSEFYKEVLNW